MFELTKEQLTDVIEIVSNSEITYSHLPDDLIDHICCDIESEMSVGLSFNKALERVQCKFGDSGLQKIQEDTILLIDQKYRFMKTTMKIFGNVSLALIGIGTIFKIFHWPGATIGLVLGFLLLGLVFYPATILASYRKNGRKNIFLHILAILGGVALIFGILFKINHWPGASMLLGGGWMALLIIFLPLMFIIYALRSSNRKETLIYSFGVIGVIIFELSSLFNIMHWPGAKILLIVGAILIVTVFLPLYAFNLYKKSEFVNGKFIYVTLLISFFLLFGLLINLNFTKRIFKGLSYSDKYAKVEAGYCDRVNNNLIQNINYQTDEHISIPVIIHQKSDSLSAVIRKLKHDLILISGDTNESELNKYIGNIDLIPNKTHGQMVERLFFGEGNSAQQLKKGLSDYKKYLVSVSKPGYSINNDLDDLLFFGDIPEYGYYKTWENRMFKYNIVYMTLVQLSNIDRNVKLSENLILMQYSIGQDIADNNLNNPISE